ncbi:unnamed protein product [Dibothriocephalus latus]|uniref:Uncharacterized protein n=1 Tax=Dibothriocephalus latus TaxID=60516 RepID=A0A3P7P2U7_DIBLA|nr:unnamed protein product [Dibothriocephalus latus]
MLTTQQGFVYEPVRVEGPEGASGVYFRRVDLPPTPTPRWTRPPSRTLSNPSEYEKIDTDPGSIADMPSGKKPQDQSSPSTTSTAVTSTVLDRAKLPLPEKPKDDPVLT